MNLGNEFGANVVSFVMVGGDSEWKYNCVCSKHAVIGM